MLPPEQCWMTTAHPALRLWTHYFWIFAAQFFTVLLYAITFIQLRRKITECIRLGGGNTDSLRRLNRVVGYMVIYPVVYITLTLPLAAGRMASVSGHPPSVTYFCVAGSLMTLSGLCDTLLYTLTRRNSVLDPEGKLTANKGTYPLTSTGRRKSTKNNVCPPTLDDRAPLPSVSAAPHHSNSTNASIPNGEIDRVAVDQIYQETTLDVAYEPVHATGANGSSDDGWKSSWPGNDISTLERGLPRSGDIPGPTESTSSSNV